MECLTILYGLLILMEIGTDDDGEKIYNLLKDNCNIKRTTAKLPHNKMAKYGYETIDGIDWILKQERK